MKSNNTTQRLGNNSRHWHQGTSKPAIPRTDARFRKHPRKKQFSGIAAKQQIKTGFRKHPHKKHINGIAANSTSNAAIRKVDARFGRHELKKHISDIAAAAAIQNQPSPM